MAKKARLPDKAAVKSALEAALASTLAATRAAAEESRRGATHEESRAEGDKDMRSTEQSYLARGQAMRAEELAEELARLETTTLPAFGPESSIALGALVRVLVDEAPRVFFVVPWGGGTTLSVGGAEVTVVAPSSPVGRALVGRSAGESFELTARGALREWEIVEVV